MLPTHPDSIPEEDEDEEALDRSKEADDGEGVEVREKRIRLTIVLHTFIPNPSWNSEKGCSKTDKE